MAQIQVSTARAKKRARASCGDTPYLSSFCDGGGVAVFSGVDNVFVVFVGGVCVLVMVVVGMVLV